MRVHKHGLIIVLTEEETTRLPEIAKEIEATLRPGEELCLPSSPDAPEYRGILKVRTGLILDDEICSAELPVVPEGAMYERTTLSEWCHYRADTRNRNIAASDTIAGIYGPTRDGHYCYEHRCWEWYTDTQQRWEYAWMKQKEWCS